MTIHVDVCTFLRNSASIILDCDHLRDESFIGTPCYIRAMAQAVKLYSKLNRPAKDRTGENRTSRLLWHCPWRFRKESQNSIWSHTANNVSPSFSLQYVGAHASTSILGCLLCKCSLSPKRSWPNSANGHSRSSFDFWGWYLQRTLSVMKCHPGELSGESDEVLSLPPQSLFSLWKIYTEYSERQGMASVEASLVFNEVR